ncbi:MAG: acyl-CoA dehydrogenase [Actinomycetia bacterium]|nr:acyl-CoA dehydrogenase [Actinomycetes bacterium]
MDFGWSAEERAIRDAARALAEREFAHDPALAPGRREYPWHVASRLAEQGFGGLCLPPADGGQGAGLLAAVLALEAVTEVAPRAGDVLAAMNFGAVQQIAAHGSAAQRARYLPDLLAGRKLVSIAMSEPEAGSAVTDLTTRAEPDGQGGYRLYGRKVFNTGGMHAHLWVVWVRFGPERDACGAVLVEREAQGLTLRPHRFMSGETYAELEFDGVPVRADDVLVARDGFRRMLRVFNVERLGNAARCLAYGQRAFDLAREHTTTRRQFGRPLCEFQGVQWTMAEMRLKLESARLLLYRAAQQADARGGVPSPEETSLAKWACNTAGFEAAHLSLQLFGGYGFSAESELSYLFARTRGWLIAGGTVEMQKNAVAEAVYGRHFPQRPPAGPHADPTPSKEADVHA